MGISGEYPWPEKPHVGPVPFPCKEESLLTILQQFFRNCSASWRQKLVKKKNTDQGVHYRARRQAGRAGTFPSSRMLVTRHRLVLQELPVDFGRAEPLHDLTAPPQARLQSEGHIVHLSPIQLFFSILTLSWIFSCF